MLRKKKSTPARALLMQLTDEEFTLLAGPSVDSQLPVVFDNGARFGQLMGECLFCKTPLRRHALRGQVTRTAGNLYAIRAIGICISCRNLTKFNYRLNDNLTITEPGSGKIISQSLPATAEPRKSSRFFSED
ncbi:MULTISPECIES: hypothetical protein [unclassified Paludibacterium]|uniref:hypothetical protein n=1 Tax=unclassified Paludibacterium TaxID=2618429 RepID=UPI001C05BA8E|nr:hypothetical protein [Paludibacterium sp. B53371]BEV71784.1 hypothetical protein THUN1379_12660 [Paludibacterium sp. THUN1379]